MRDERTDPPDDKPDKEPDAAPPDDANAGDLLATLREDKFFAANLDERDVSIVYIDRRSQTFQTAPPASGARFADRAVRRERRIGEIVVSALSAAEVAAVQATFTPPVAFAAAQQCFRQQGLVILHGPAGSGKRSAAIRLLAAIRYDDAGPPPIYEINPDLRLVDLKPDDVPDKTALVLEASAGGALEGMTAFRWHALQEKLGPQQRNNGLVITVERLPALFPPTLRDSIIAWQAAWPGDRTAVQWNILERHLTHLIRQEEITPAALATQLAQWRDDAHLTALLAERLMPYQIADLAAALLPVLAGTYGLDVALARQDLQVAEAVRAWFASPDHALDLKTLLIAAAVYNGALADEVDLAAGDLQAVLAPPPAKRDAPPAPADPFAGGNTRSACYRQIGATLVTTPIQGMHYGSTSGLALQLDNSAWQKAVLDHLWSEYSALRAPLLAWLERYALEGSQRQRVRAAAAIGGLARLNFPLIEANILRQWANSHDPNARRAAGQVLGITMWDEQHSAASSGLLRHWATADNWRLRWTAAAACGGLAGLRYPEQTLDLLENIAAACVEQPRLLPPVTEAVVKLYLAVRSDPDRRAAILHALRAWGEQSAKEPKARARAFALRRAAVLCLWALLWPAPNDLAWRQLLADMAVPGAPVQADGIVLLRASFNFRQPADSVRDNLHPRKVAQQGLHALIIAVANDGDTALMEQGIGMLQALVRACRQADAASGGDDEWARLRYYAEDWDTLSDKASELRNLLL